MKILIVENTLVNYGDDRGGQDQAQGDIIDVPKETASKLALANRSLYMNKADDPSKAKIFTASQDIIKAAKDAAATKEAAAKAAAQKPTA